MMANKPAMTFNTWSETDYKELLDAFRELLPHVKAVSFDVFDTTLQRVVFPKEVFAILETEAIARFGNHLSSLADRRIQAEKQARVRKRKHASHGEIGLEEIYDELARKCPEWKAYTSNLMDMEYEVEQRCCRPHPLGRQLWEMAASAEIKVCFISDMYLGQIRIEELLKASGYTNATVICSSDHGRNKSSGTLYTVASNQLDLKSEEILYVGDNHHSDYVQARAQGFQSLPFPEAAVPPSEAKNFPNVSPQENALAVSNGLIRGELWRRITDTSKQASDGNQSINGNEIGYSVLGPLAYGLCQWIISQIEKEGTDLLLCLGRDGHLPYQVIKFWQETYNILPKTRIVYMPSSRRAMAMALVSEGISPLVSATLGRHRRSVPLREYFIRIGLEPESFKEAIQTAGFEGPNDIVHRSHDRKRIEELLGLIEEPLRKLGQTEKSAMLEALREHGIHSASKPAIFDLGWRGSQQACLQSILGNSDNLKGYYLSISDSIATPNTTAGYIVEDGQPQEIRGLFEAATPVIELLFSSPEPTFLYYQKTNNKIVPVYDEDNPNSEAILQLQTAALRFLHDFSHYHQGPVAQFSKSDALKNFEKMALNPEPQQVEFLKSLVFSDALGKESTQPLTQISPPPLKEYLCDYPKFFEAYSATNWRAHFVQQMSLPAKLWVWPRSPSFRRIWRAMRQKGN